METRESKIIKNGNISVETEDFSSFVDGIIQQVKDNQGYVEENNTDVVSVRQDKKLRFGSLKLRIPQESFDIVVKYIEENSSINHRNISETDVSKQYYELDNQITNLRVQEENLRELLAKSETVADTLQIENELRRIRTEIDSLSMDLSDIDDKSSMSTIRLDVEEVIKTGIEVPEGSSLWKRAGEGFINTVNGLMELLQTVIIGIISLSPILVILVVVILVVCLVYRKKRRK